MAVSISVIIPTHRRPDALGICLQALAGQTYPRDAFEVVVVGDRNAPGSAEGVIRAVEGRLAVRYATAGSPGPAAARNAGANAAAAPVLAFTDDDCVPDREWLAALAKACAAEPDALVGGRTADVEPAGLCTAASRVVLDYFCAGQNADPADLRFFPSNNLALPAARFKAMGGFDTRFDRAAGEDRDLCARWRAAGGRLTYAHDAVVRHAHPLSLATFVRQQMSYGRGAFRFRAVSAGRRFGPPAFYAGLLAYPFRHAPTPRAAALAGLVAVSQAAVFAGYVSELAFAGLKGFRSGD